MWRLKLHNKSSGRPALEPLCCAAAVHRALSSSTIPLYIWRDAPTIVTSLHRPKFRMGSYQQQQWQ